MTVKNDLQKAIASCESTKGTYAMMADSTQDPQAKQTFTSMKNDLDRHVQFLTDRLDYLNQNNQLNQQQ